MPDLPRLSHFPVSLFASPKPLHQELFYTVPRAGHLVGGHDHHISRDHFPGHELILCLKGRGYVRIAGHTHPVNPGDLVWVNCHRPHQHGPVEGDPWEVYWIRVEGPRLEKMCQILSISTNPVFTPFKASAAAPIFEEIFKRIPDESTTNAAFIHSLVSRLIAQVFAAREQLSDTVREVSPVLHQVIKQMKLFYFESYRVEQLAQLCGMSPSHFAHAFKSAFGTSPIDWLRKERITQAKHRLAETKDRIGEIALQVGYSDRFYFSKDFKRLTGLTPTEFRKLEGN